MRLSAIAAVAHNGVIGRDGDLPWRLPADLRWFVRHTKGKPIISGRKTYESTGYLKGRRNVVITRQTDYQCDADVVSASIDGALSLFTDDDEVMILGGAGIYAEVLPRLDRLYLTVVSAEPTGDTHFPPLDPDQWTVVSREPREADDKNAHDMTFLVLDREVYGPATSQGSLATWSGRP